MNKHSDDYYNKKIDVELKKQFLEKEYNAHFNQESNLSPDFEMEWLNYLEEFEKKFSEAQKTTVWEYIGKPTFRKTDEIDLYKVRCELQKLLDYMNKNNIVLSTLSEVGDKELYRFITEELFYQEIENIHIKGMDSIFIYEDFYPNAEYEIMMAYDYFFSMTMAKNVSISGDGYDLLYIDTRNYKNTKGEKMNEKEVTKKITEFLDSFDYFEIDCKKVKNLFINEDKSDAQLSFEIQYRGCFTNCPEFVAYKGNGYFRLYPNEYGGWSIYQLDVPGLQL